MIRLMCDMVEKGDVDGWGDTNELTYVGGDGSSRYEWKYVKKKCAYAIKQLAKGDVETIDLMKLNFKC